MTRVVTVGIRRPVLTGLLGAAGALTAVTVWTLLGHLAGLLWCIGTAAFLASGLHVFVRGLERRGMGRRTSVVVVVTALGAAVCTTLTLIVPQVIAEGAQMLERARTFSSSGGLEQVAAQLQGLVPITVIDVDRALRGLVDGALASVTVETLSADVIGAGALAGNVVTAVSIVVVLTVYFLATHRWFLTQALALAPRRHRATVRSTATLVGRAVGRCFVGQVGLAVLYGVLTLVALLTTNAALPLLFAFVAFVAALVPLVGIALSALVIVGAQLLIDPQRAGVWLALGAGYLVYQAVEAYVIAPRVARVTTSVPDVVALLVTLVGGALGGVSGALLALPVAVAVAAGIEAARESGAGRIEQIEEIEAAGEHVTRTDGDQLPGIAEDQTLPGRISPVS